MLIFLFFSNSILAMLINFMLIKRWPGSLNLIAKSKWLYNGQFFIKFQKILLNLIEKNSNFFIFFQFIFSFQKFHLKPNSAGSLFHGTLVLFKYQQ